ncbi:MAG: hypothetical protein IIZ87_00405, partial [Selenomonas sp.]|nr:hypothetical protein [Selenomonas sp.]
IYGGTYIYIAAVCCSSDKHANPSYKNALSQIYPNILSAGKGVFLSYIWQFVCAEILETFAGNLLMKRETL